MSRVLDLWAGMTGTVLPFAGSAAPTGWLFCHGQAVSRATYAELFGKIGTTYGVGDGSTTFNLPDTRDEFIRGKGDSRALGSKQDATNIRINGIDSIADTTYVRPTATIDNGDGDAPIMGTRLLIDKTQTTTENFEYTKRNVRPRNIALNHIIKI